MIQLVEVSPRDGLQNELVTLTVADRVALIERAVEAGARRIEVASFVDPRRVPQMAGAEEVVAALPHRDVVSYIGLVLNRRGAERALSTGLDELGLVCIASDAFGAANQRQTSDESIDMAIEVHALATRAGRRAQVTIAVAFGCPYAGAVAPARVVAIARRLAAAGFDEIALADTIGIAKPDEVERLVTIVRDAIAPAKIRLHFHDTRGTALANVFAARRAGARIFDSSLAGAGGCPFAPGAAGNVATEDLVYATGADTGLDLNRCVEAALWLAGRLGRPTRGALSQLAAK